MSLSTPKTKVIATPKKSGGLQRQTKTRDALLKGVLRASFDGIITLSKGGVIESLNPAAVKMFGYQEDELLGKRITDLLPPDEEQEAFALSTRPNGFGNVREMVGVRKDAISFPLELTFTEIGMNRQQLSVVILRDITEKKKTNSVYLQKASELQAVFEVLPDCFLRLTPEGVILDYHANNVARFNTKTPKSLIGNRLPNIFPTNVGAQFEKAITEVKKTSRQVDFEYDLSTNSGQQFFKAYIKLSLKQQVIVIIRDITERKNQKDLLEQYNGLGEILPVGIFRSNGCGELVYVNGRWREIANLNVNQVTYADWEGAIFREDRARVAKQWNKCVTMKHPFKSEFRFRHKDGHVVWAYCQAVVEHNTAGDFIGHLGTVTEITDRIKADERLQKAHRELEVRVEERTADLRAKNRWLQQVATERERAEKALREERNFISAVLETAGALVVVRNREGRIIQFNRSCQDRTGYSLSDVKGNFVWDLFLPEDEIAEAKNTFGELAEGKQHAEHEGHWITRAGDQRLISWSSTTISDAEQHVTHVICTGIDITEQRLAEEELRQHQADLVHVSRLCTMGEMAAGLAHELNQPLAAIVSYTQGCVRRIANGNHKPHELLNAMKQVTGQAQRAGEIIRHLRNFTSNSELQRTSANLNAMVREVLNMAKVDIRNQGVTVRLRLADPLPSVSVETIQIEQVLLNLIRNGMEAMTNTGKDARELIVRTFVNDEEKVHISISDAGEGLPKNLDPNKVFDAFFTTKSNGMGMGLAISRSIIESHDGRLWATRNPDRGTTFHFTLPALT